MTEDQKFQVSARIRSLADECEKRAAEFDNYENPDKKYHTNSIAWAQACRAQLRIDAGAYRDFAKEVLQ